MKLRKLGGMTFGDWVMAAIGLVAFLYWMLS